MPLWVCCISTHFINFKYEYEHEYGGYSVDGGGCGGCGWCVYSPTCPLRSAPTAPKPVEESAEKSVEKCAFGLLPTYYIEWVGHVELAVWMGPPYAKTRIQWAKGKAKEEKTAPFVLSLSFMTCHRLDCIHVYNVMAAVAAIASCFCCCC